MQLPNEMDAPGTDQATVEAMYQLLQIWQLGHNSKPSGNHQNAPVITDRGAQAMRSTENYAMEIGFFSLMLDFSIFPGVVEKPAGKSVPRFYQKIKASSFAFGPRGNHERVALPKGPKSDGRNPYVDVLSGFDLPRPYDSDIHPDSAIISRYQSPGVASAK